jgi:hypothetical protein
MWLALGLLTLASCVDSPDTLPSTTSTSIPTTTSTSVADFEWPVVAGYESMHWPSGPVSGVPVSFPDPMYCGCSLVTLHDGRVLMVGSGYGIGYAARIWDPETRGWTETGSPSSAWAGYSPGLVTMDDGRVLVAMGGSLEVYDPTAGSFHLVGNFASFGGLLGSFSGIPSLALMTDGRVLLAKGTTSGVVFDPVTEDLEALGAPRSPESTSDVIAAVTLNDGRVLILSYMSASVYDPVTGLFERLDPVLPLQRGLAASPLPDGRILITGGESLVDNEGDLGLADVQTFDPTTNRFEAARSLLEPRSRHSALALPDGRVAIIGGADGRVELFDPDTGLFVEAPELSRPRDRPAVAALEDGSLLVAGGDDAGAITPGGYNLDTTTFRTAEIYHPQLGTTEQSVVGLSGLTLKLEIDAPHTRDTARRSLWLELDVPAGALDGIVNARAVWELMDPTFDGTTVVLWMGPDDRRWGWVGNEPVERPLPTECDEGCVIREAISASLAPSTLRGLYLHITYDGEIPDEAAQITMTIVDE